VEARADMTMHPRSYHVLSTVFPMMNPQSFRMLCPHSIRAARSPGGAHSLGDIASADIAPEAESDAPRGGASPSFSDRASSLVPDRLVGGIPDLIDLL